MRQIVHGSTGLSQPLLEQRIARLERQVAELAATVRALTAAAGRDRPAPPPLPDPPVPCHTPVPPPEH